MSSITPLLAQRYGLFAFIPISLFIFVYLLHLAVPYDNGWELIWRTTFHYDSTDFQQLTLRYTFLPRLGMALLVGFAMGVAGCVMQFILRNPIASPTTLGVSAGAELGLILGILLIPKVFGFEIPSLITAFIGACLATSFVFLLSSKRDFEPIQMVLSGMVISLLFGSLSTMLVLLNEYKLAGVMVWGTGALNQNGWDNIQQLLPLIIIPISLLLILSRPLSVLQLGERAAKSIGINVSLLKFSCLTLAILMTSAVVSSVGIIGFIGVIAPAICRLAGIRKLIWQILGSGLVGVLMLIIADLLIQILSNHVGEMFPTGAMTALLGAPIFLWLLLQHRWSSDSRAHIEQNQTFKHSRFLLLTSVLSIALISTMTIAIFFGNTTDGWEFTLQKNVLDLRIPRVFSSVFAGVGLAVAGTIIQRITSNPMASPEVLGISSGVAFALVLGAITGTALSRETQFVTGTIGAIVVMLLLWQINKKQHFLSTQLLLVGIVLSASLDAGVKIAITSGGESVTRLINWFSGSTYLVSEFDTLFLMFSVSVLIVPVYLYSKQLDILYLGNNIAGSLGINLANAKRIQLFVAAVLTAICTIIIGPLSFVGLIAPHMARSLHQYNAKHQLIIASILGASIMTLADWFGRNLWFPWQFPAGLLAAIIGGLYFVYLLRK